MRRQDPGAAHKAALAAMKPVLTDIKLVRIGGDADGGYLVPDDLDGVAACFSPGVNLVADFERELIDRGIKSFQIDASVENSPLVHPMNVFERKFLGFETKGKFISLDDWVNQYAPGNEDLILQIDIEGAEWLALAAASAETLKRFRIIVIEMHFLEYLAEQIGSLVIAPIIERLVDMFHFVHLHANNGGPLHFHAGDYECPSLLEATLLRKDRAVARGPVMTLPHPLDRDNCPQLPPTRVPSWLYG